MGRTEPYYSTLSQKDMDTVTALVRRVGFTPIIGALGDILTQNPNLGLGTARAPELSLLLGQTFAASKAFDGMNPPAG